MGFDIYQAVREARLEWNKALIDKISQGNPNAISELAGLFVSHDPSLVTWKWKLHLQLVSDESRREVSDLLWMEIPTLWNPQPKLIWLQNETYKDISNAQYTRDVKNMTQEEFTLFISLFFQDTDARDLFVSLFFREKDRISEWLKQNLNDVYEQVFEEEPSNTHTLGVTEVPETFAQFWWRFWNDSKKRKMKYWKIGLLNKARVFFQMNPRRKFEYYSSQSKIRQSHGTFWDNFFVRLTKTLWWHMNLRKTQLIDFPKPYYKSKIKSKEIQAKKLRPDTPKVIEQAFIAIMRELAQLSENIEWFIGVRDSIFIPDEIQKQLSRMKELESLGWLHNFHQHIESTLSMLIVYYYPEMMQDYGKEKSQNISKAKLEKYPSLQEIPRTHSSPQKRWDENSNLWSRFTDTIVLEMDERVAEYYWFFENRKLRCSPQLIKHIFSLPDEEPVVFDIWWKKAEISAKMFRRVFHREWLPDKTETGNILKFVRKI